MFLNLRFYLMGGFHYLKTSQLWLAFWHIRPVKLMIPFRGRIGPRKRSQDQNTQFRHPKFKTYGRTPFVSWRKAGTPEDRQGSKDITEGLHMNFLRSLGGISVSWSRERNEPNPNIGQHWPNSEFMDWFKSFLLFQIACLSWIRVELSSFIKVR